MAVIFHIDVNSAFLSWSAVEQLKNGADVDIRTIPAIIGGDRKSRHGVVLAKSVPAKKYGIRTGEPVVNALAKCPSLVMSSPDHKMYKEYSDRLMKFLRTYTDRIEQVSVDECYLDFTELAPRYSSPVDGALEIKNRVKETFGFTVNIGISSNKLLAKMASDFEKPDKVHTLFPEEIQVKMWPLPIGELYMAGKSSVEKLNRLEINTIGDLAKTDPSILELHLKSHGRMLWEFANGIGNEQVEPEPEQAKGIGNSTTLARDIDSLEEASKVLGELAASVGRRLRKAGQKAGMLGVEIKYSDFRKVSHQKQLEKPSNQDTEIQKEAVELFREFWTGEPIRLLGIRSSRLMEQSGPEQISLFDAEFQMEFREDVKKRTRKKQLDDALKKVRDKYGEGIVKKGM